MCVRGTLVWLIGEVASQTRDWLEYHMGCSGLAQQPNLPARRHQHQQSTVLAMQTAAPANTTAADDSTAAIADDASSPHKRQLGELTWRQLDEYGVASMADVMAAREAREAACAQLHAYLARTDVSGQDKGWARCDHILRHGTLLFQCPGCFLLPGNCICARVRRASPATKVVIHFHPDEWSRGSNTGCLCGVALAGSERLLMGHRPHDLRFQQLLECDPAYTVAVLWPAPGALEPEQLRQLAAERSGGRIALVAVDANWEGANRMRKKYDDGRVVWLKLPAALALPAQQQQSLFAPLRKYHGVAAANGRVCTLEAVAAALLALEGDTAMYEGLLDALKLKVDAMRRQKHMAPVYGALD